MYIMIAVLISYFLIVLVIGFVARTRWKSTPETYFLADRKLGTLILLGTMVATNFSAFTVFALPAPDTATVMPSFRSWASGRDSWP